MEYLSADHAFDYIVLRIVKTLLRWWIIVCTATFYHIDVYVWDNKSVLLP